jgi:hypothetical protein
MKQERLDEIKKELEKLIDFREGTGMLKGSFFGEYQGTSIHLTYDGDYSSIWIGNIDNEHKANLSMSLMECSVEIEESMIRFCSKNCVIDVGE